MSDYETALSELYSVRDFIRWGASRFREEALFFGHGTDNAWDESTALVLNGLFLPADSDGRVLDARLTQPEKKRVLMLLERRISEHLPAPYITGIAWFCGLEFQVDERVIIPRSPIAELIERHFAPWCAEEPGKILDLCTGSGCIGIACAYAFPDADIDLSDVSTDALAVAEQNILMHNLDGRVRTVESDLFTNIKGRQYDLIVTNPPYVDAEDFQTMPSEYQHEPELALVSGDDGLNFSRRLLREAADYLTDRGILVLEVGNSWPALEQAYPDIEFTWVEFKRGGHGVCVLTKHQLLRGEGH